MSAHAKGAGSLSTMQLRDAQIDTMRAAADAAPSPLAALLRVGDALRDDALGHDTRNNSLDELEATLAAARSTDGLHAARQRQRAEQTALLEDLVRQAQSAGELEPTADPHALAFALEAWSLGMHQLALEAPDALDPAAVSASYRALLQTTVPVRASASGSDVPVNSLKSNGVSVAPSNSIAAPARARILLPPPAPIPLPVPGRPQTDENLTPPADMSKIALLALPPKMRKSGGVSLAESFTSAFRSLAANKMRSALTMLGIIIGVGSVVSLLAIGNGVTASVTGQLNSQGTNLIFIQGASASTNGVQNGNRVRSITVDDAKALAQPGAVPDAVAVSPETQQTGQVTAGNANVYGTYVGCWPDYTIVHDYQVASGDFITDSDLSTGAAVVALGANVATNLFGSDDPIGKNVRIAGKSFRVVGVMQAKGGTFSSPDDEVYVPLTTALSILVGDQGAGTNITGSKTVPVIFLKGNSPNTVTDTVSEITDVLNPRHRVQEGVKADYQVTTQADIIKSVQSTLGLINVFLAVVAGISLLVGGIGIMNIMLVSVTERTREIGVRKAIGARESDILTQFVVEAILISLLGAFIGVMFGLSVSLIVSKLWQPSVPSVSAIVVSVVVAMMTGLFFGVYPARRAARLKPIDALRYE